MESKPPHLFEGDERARDLYATVINAVKDLGEVDVRVGKSQVAFRRNRSFAAVWSPGRYLHGKVAPLVLTIYLPVRDPSSRWKQIVEPAEGHFTHHLELWRKTDVDEEVIHWLRQAWRAAE